MQALRDRQDSTVQNCDVANAMLEDCRIRQAEPREAVPDQDDDADDEVPLPPAEPLVPVVVVKHKAVVPKFGFCDGKDLEKVDARHVAKGPAWYVQVEAVDAVSVSRPSHVLFASWPSWVNAAWIASPASTSLGWWRMRARPLLRFRSH